MNIIKWLIGKAGRTFAVAPWLAHKDVNTLMSGVAVEVNCRAAMQERQPILARMLAGTPPSDTQGNAQE